MTPQMMPVAPVGADLRAARVAAGLTIEQLAVSAGIGSATVERIEHGRVTPHRSTLLALALVLSLHGGVDLEDDCAASTSVIERRGTSYLKDESAAEGDALEAACRDGSRDANHDHADQTRAHAT